MTTTVHALEAKKRSMATLIEVLDIDELPTHFDKNWVEMETWRIIEEAAINKQRYMKGLQTRISNLEKELAKLRSSE